MGMNLWGIDRELILRCVNALAMDARLVQQAADVETRRPYAERRQFAEIEAETAAFIRPPLTLHPPGYDSPHKDRRQLTVRHNIIARPRDITAGGAISRTAARYQRDITLSDGVISP